MVNQPVALERAGEHIGVVRINNPPANALTLAMRLRLRDIWCEIRDDDTIDVAIVTGTGDKFFSAGLDMKELAAERADDTKPAHQRKAEMDLLDWGPGSASLWKPVIAAINGYCLAGGFNLAHMCDVRIARSDALFGIPEVRWAHPASFAWQLPRSLPLNIAMELVLWGDRQLDARRMYEVGFLNAVVAPENLMAVAVRWAQEVSAMSPAAVRLHKRMLYEATYADTQRMQAWAAELLGELHDNVDAQEGLAAFLERRPPTWSRGR
jgi:enoyl-CoA hydratase/carnithine racemase